VNSGLPLPPGDLAKRALPITELRSGDILHRVHAVDRGCLWFGPAPGAPPVNRFDDPLGEFRVCYLGTSAEACFAETFLRNPPVRILALSDLSRRSLTPVEVVHNLRLVPLYGAGLAKLGATAEVVNERSYRVSRAWSRALWGHPEKPDGIQYRSRHDDDAFCVALFDRAEQALVAGQAKPLWENAWTLAALLDRYGIGLTH
jgi:RES domain